MPIAKKKPKRVTQFRVYASWRDRMRHATVRTIRGIYTSKREATRRANRVARTDTKVGIYPRQVSVYAVPPGQIRGSLVHQVHFNSKSNRLIHEEL